MKYLSVFSGIEAASVAWHPLGWTPAGFAEIEKFPCAVLAHHYPDVPNFGDVNLFREWPDADVDLLVGGSPCQSFSVAGLRQGLADPRGNLALTYLGCVDRYRPEWVVWENVPGVLSVDGGRAFGSFLGGLAELGYGFAYRILDAQFVRVDGFGRAVPQRRRRVLVVGHSAGWRRAAAVLFERESLSWDSPPRRQAGQGIATDVAPSLVGSGRGVERIGETRGQDPVVAGTLGQRTCDHASGIKSESDFLVAGALGGTSPGGGWRFGADEAAANQLVPEVVPPLDASYARLQGCSGQDLNHGHSHLIPFGGNNTAGPIDVSTAVNAHGGPVGQLDFETETFVAHSLRANGFDASEDGTGRGTPLVPIAFDSKASGRNGFGTGPVSPTLRAMSHKNSQPNSGGQVAVAFDMRGRDGGAQFEGPHDTANIRAASGGSSRSYLQQLWAVRRLTPTECERLQGFPDGYTDIPWRGKNHAPDGPRYKALGNSMAANCMRWLGRRIEMIAGL